MKRFGALLAVLAVAAFTSMGGSAAVKATPKAGGTLNVGLGSTLACLDPQQTTVADALIIDRQIADSLVAYDPKTNKIVPWLATSWKVNKTATQFVFHLRSGVTFSDGTPFNAAVVKANLDYIYNTLGGIALRDGPSGYLTGYIGTTVVNNLTALVNFSAPNGPFLVDASTDFLPMLSLASTRLTPAQRCQGNLVGSGPFVIKNNDANQTITLAKRSTPYTWAPKLTLSNTPAHNGAYLDSIVFSVIPVSSVRAGEVASGQLGVATNILVQDRATIKSSGGIILNRVVPGMPLSILVNTDANPLLGIQGIRRAIMLGIDRKTIVQTLFEGIFPAATSVVTNTTAGYTNLASLMPFDPKAAEAKLTALGWVPGSDGIRVKNGQQLSFNLTWYNGVLDWIAPMVQLLQQQMATIGIKLDLTQLTPAQVSTVVARHDFQAYLVNITDADPDILRAVDATPSGTLPQTAAVLASGIGKILINQRAATPDTRAAVLVKVQKALIGEAFNIPIVDNTLLMGVSKGVNGVHFDQLGRLIFYDTWLS